VLVAKCINAKKTNKLSEESNLFIVVVPKRYNYETNPTDQIYVSTTTVIAIKRYLETITSPFAKIGIGNARYEKIKVICNVAFNAENIFTDKGLNSRRLNEDINAYISPW